MVAYDGTYVVDKNGKNLTTIIQPIEAISDAVVETMIGLIEKQKVVWTVTFSVSFQVFPLTANGKCDILLSIVRGSSFRLYSG